MKQPVREILQDTLRNSVIRVRFTKANGDDRVMYATQDLSLIPVEHHPKNPGSAENPDVCRVFDTEAQGWRSFRYDSVIEVG